MESAPTPLTRWSRVAVIVAVVLGVPALLDQGTAQRQPFDERPLRALEKSRPRVVLIGDSMLETRIVQKQIDQLAGERWEVLAQPGSSSAIWYLMMKNLIAVQSPSPRVVILFFRERQLTRPAQRTTGGYRKTIESYMSNSEPVVEKLLETSNQREQTRLERIAMALYPVQWRQEKWRDRLQNRALDLVASSRDFQKIRDDTKEVFKLRNLRQDTGEDFESEERAKRVLDPSHEEFGTAITDSFLPAILKIAREKNIHLIFFRVKGKPPTDGRSPSQPGEFEVYNRELRDYLEKAGAQYVDEIQNADVTLKFYGSDDHVAPAMMKEYTELFWRDMSPRMPPASAAAPDR